MSKSRPFSDSGVILISIVFVGIMVLASVMAVSLALWLYGLFAAAVEWFAALPVVGMP